MTVHDDTIAVLEEWRKNTAELKRTADFLESALPHLIEVSSIAKSLGEIVLSLNFQKANTLPTQTGPLKQRDTTPTPRQLNWRPFKSGTPGGWIESDENLPLCDTLLAAKNKTVVLEGYTYRLSGDGDRWIQRFPARPGK
jgi:hypothetical protein